MSGINVQTFVDQQVTVNGHLTGHLDRIEMSCFVRQFKLRGGAGQKIVLLIFQLLTICSFFNYSLISLCIYYDQCEIL